MGYLSLRFDRLSLTQKLVIPFVAILVGAITLLGGLFIQSEKSTLNSRLDKKTEVLVRNLAAAVGEPFSVGEYDKIQQLLVSAKDIDDDIAFLVVMGNDGRGVASTDASWRNVVLNRTSLEASALQAHAYALREAPGDLSDAVIPVMASGQQLGILRVGVSHAAVRTAVRNALATFFSVGALALLIGIGIYGIVTRRVASQIRLIGDRLEELARGASDLTVRLPVTSSDEVGRLASAFNLFVESLGRLVGQIRTSSEQVGNSSKALSEITQQFSSNVSQAVQVMSQISQNTGQVAQNTQSAATSTQQAGSIAQQGGKLAVQVVEKMKEAQTSVSSAAGFIHELGKRSVQIGEIVNVITKIADQTNLLSLNAAIEAARAGDSGRGFAVVADEIRKLAESSADSAQQITELIKEVQEETRRAIEVTERGNREVADGYKFTQEAEKLFSAIAMEVTQVSLQVSQVASNVQQVAASTEEATASSEEQSAAIHEVANNAQELSQIVGRLATLVAQFKTA